MILVFKQVHISPMTQITFKVGLFLLIAYQVIFVVTVLLKFNIQGLWNNKIDFVIYLGSELIYVGILCAYIFSCLFFINRINEKLIMNKKELQKREINSMIENKKNI